MKILVGGLIQFLRNIITPWSHDYMITIAGDFYLVLCGLVGHII